MISCVKAPLLAPHSPLVAPVASASCGIALASAASTCASSEYSEKPSVAGMATWYRRATSGPAKHALASAQLPSHA